MVVPFSMGREHGPSVTHLSLSWILPRPLLEPELGKAELPGVGRVKLVDLPWGDGTSQTCAKVEVNGLHPRATQLSLCHPLSLPRPLNLGS